jgi:hypothetical protein
MRSIPWECYKNRWFRARAVKIGPPASAANVCAANFFGARDVLLYPMRHMLGVKRAVSLKSHAKKQPPGNFSRARVLSLPLFLLGQRRFADLPLPL